MASARQGLAWWELDVTYYSLWALEKCGIIWDLRRPRAEARGVRGSASRAGMRGAPARES
jgi:fatty-acid desaturase